MKGKKLLSIALSLLMAQSIVATTAVSSSAFDTQQVVSEAKTETITSEDSYNGYEYSVSGGKATITKYTGSATDLTIPSTLGGYAVTGIGYGAFSDCKSITNVTIPNSVTQIGDCAFYECESLADISIPDSVIRIGRYAFENTAWYNNQPNGLVYAGKVAYKYKGEMPENTKISLRDGTKGIAPAVFSLGLINCFNLTEVIIPESVTYIGVSAFSGCAALESVTIPDSVTVIESYAFYECYSLTGVIIPKSVTVIENSAFNSSRFGSITNLEDRNFTIHGYKGTVAETYANENGFNFISLEDAVLPTSIKLNKPSITLGVGESYTFTKTVLPTNASTNYIWSSNDMRIATINSSGKITAKGAGTTTITVKTSNGKSATCTVTVKKAPTSNSLNKTKLTLGVGETFDFNSSIPSGSASYNVKYTSSNTSVATVNASGGIMTAKKAGTAIITSTTYNGKKATCTVTVKNAPSKVSLNKTKLTVGVGETFDFNCTIPNGTASYRIKYTSNNTSVATVKASGGIMTAKKAGTATITATTHNGKKATCIVTVKNAPSKVSLNKTKLTVGVGETFDFNCTIPNGTASYRIKYTSNNTSVATVKASGGIMTAKKAGTATITATTHNGKKATCIVTVKNAPSKISLNKTKITVGVGETFDFNSSLPSGTASYRIKYTSNNTSVATVKASGGLMTAKKAGTATITATTYNGKKATCVVTVKNAPSKISLNKTKITLNVGQTFDLNSSLPSGTASYSVKYTSNNTGVATVKASGGLVTAKKKGTATITATTYNGKKATCVVTVKNTPSRISLNKTKITLNVGQTFDLNSSLPSGTASYSVKYTSNNTGVATVKASGGLVTAKKKGTATITATTYNGKKATCVVTVK